MSAASRDLSRCLLVKLYNSESKRRDESRRGTQECVRHVTFVVLWYIGTFIGMLSAMKDGSSADRSQTVLIAHGMDLETKPAVEWQAAVRRGTNKMRARLDFMTAGHHAVRTFVVRELSQSQRPIPIVEIAAHVQLPTAQVQSIVEELERKLFFLVRNTAGAVAWAFPVTAGRTLTAWKSTTGHRA